MKETLEEAMESYLDSPLPHSYKRVVEFGAKWQQERSYSEEEVFKIVEQAIKDYNNKQLHLFDGSFSNPIYSNLEKWFEQFKNK